MASREIKKRRMEKDLVLWMINIFQIWRVETADGANLLHNVKGVANSEHTSMGTRPRIVYGKNNRVNEINFGAVSFKTIGPFKNQEKTNNSSPFKNNWMGLCADQKNSKHLFFSRCRGDFFYYELKIIKKS